MTEPRDVGATLAAWWRDEKESGSRHACWISPEKVEQGTEMVREACLREMRGRVETILHEWAPSEMTADYVRAVFRAATEYPPRKWAD